LTKFKTAIEKVKELIKVKLGKENIQFFLDSQTNDETATEV
jgi:hypothetical protein